jgi:hypothetical protein
VIHCRSTIYSIWAEMRTLKVSVSPDRSTMRLLSTPRFYRLKPSMGQVYGSIQMARLGVGSV